MRQAVVHVPDEPVPESAPSLRPREASDPFRYGIYLRPDPRTCSAVTVITGQLRAQYGLRSAGAFPPHATLVGSQAFRSAEGDVVDAVTAALVRRPAFDVHNAGVRPQGRGYVYDVHWRPDGSVNDDLVDLAAAIEATVAPLRHPVRTGPTNDYDAATFHAHLSLASHDLYERPDLADEVGAYLRGLDVPVPDRFAGDTVVMVRTSCPDWTGRWWRTMTWEHVRSWTLRAT